MEPLWKRLVACLISSCLLILAPGPGFEAAAQVIGATGRAAPATVAPIGGLGSASIEPGAEQVSLSVSPFSMSLPPGVGELPAAADPARLDASPAVSATAPQLPPALETVAPAAAPAVTPVSRGHSAAPESSFRDAARGRHPERDSASSPAKATHEARPILDGIVRQSEQVAAAKPGSPAAQASLDRLFELRPAANDESGLVPSAAPLGSLVDNGLLRADASAPQMTDAAPADQLPSPDQKAYAASLQPPRPLWARVALGLWTAAGLTGLMALGWALPYAGSIGLAIVGSVVLVESFGYAYHRFFQHVGFMSRIDQHFAFLGPLNWPLERLASIIERNQMFHWIHHMVIYPLGPDYRQPGEYRTAETAPEIKFWLPRPVKAVAQWALSLGLSWTVPGLIAGGLALLTMGVNPASLAFIGSIVLYALIVNYAHEGFHLIEHPWLNTPLLRPFQRFFRWLDKIHVFHHWDQYRNFTILFPLMDILFGTYRSPSGHLPGGLTVSDFINWRYLLTEARPATRAAVISYARHHPPSASRLASLLDVVRERVRLHPDDAPARELLGRGEALLLEISRPEPDAKQALDPRDAAYEASLKPQPRWKKLVLNGWTLVALPAVIVAGWSLPLLAWSLPLPAALAIAALGGALSVDAVGYAYHRFFQHVGFMTRIDQYLPFMGRFAQFIERNQLWHWIHHQIIHPIGKGFLREKYVPAEVEEKLNLPLPRFLSWPIEKAVGFIGLSWLAPLGVATVLAFALMGFHLPTFAFLGAAVAYIYLQLNVVHSEFHVLEHPWAKKPVLKHLARFFTWLQDIHILHHWDQRTNFTIIVPLMDMLFGTLRLPRWHPALAVILAAMAAGAGLLAALLGASAALAWGIGLAVLGTGLSTLLLGAVHWKAGRLALAAAANDDITVSDFINWRYLLTEARPSSRAAFISHSQAHPPSVLKIEQLLDALLSRLDRHPEDAAARDQFLKGLQLLDHVSNSEARRVLEKFGGKPGQLPEHLPPRRAHEFWSIARDRRASARDRESALYALVLDQDKDAPRFLLDELARQDHDPAWLQTVVALTEDVRYPDVGDQRLLQERLAGVADRLNRERGEDETAVWTIISALRRISLLIPEREARFFIPFLRAKAPLVRQAALQAVSRIFEPSPASFTPDLPGSDVLREAIEWNLEESFAGASTTTDDGARFSSAFETAANLTDARLSAWAVRVRREGPSWLAGHLQDKLGDMRQRWQAPERAAARENLDAALAALRGT